MRQGEGLPWLRTAGWIAMTGCLAGCGVREKTLTLERGRVALLLIDPVTCTVSGTIGAFLQAAKLPPHWRREVALTGIVLSSQSERVEVTSAFGLPVNTPVLSGREASALRGALDAPIVLALLVDGRRVAVRTIERVDAIPSVVASELSLQGSTHAW